MVCKLKHWSILFKGMLGTTPIEAGIAVFYWLCAVIAYTQGDSFERFIGTFPISFCLIYTINRWTQATSVRWLYYVAVLMPLLWDKMDLSFQNPVFWISVGMSQLLVLLSPKKWDNLTLAENGLCYLRDLLAAVSMATVGWILVFMIYLSIKYIFAVSFAEMDFLVYAWQAAYLLLAPLFFLVFHTKPQPVLTGNRFLEMLVNFVFSPALIAYCLILYLYILKIGLSGSLPKGGITYMVLAFFSFLLLVKAVQPFLNRRYYSWFYNYFSGWVLPALIMLWIAIGVRISEYGLTEFRLYAVLAGIVVTLITIGFWFHRWARYAWYILITVSIFSLFSYFPGITAEDISVRMQEKRMMSLMKAVEAKSIYPEGEKDQASPELYRSLYETAVYLQSRKGKDYLEQRWGFQSRDLDLLYEKGTVEEKDSYNSWIYITDGGKLEVDIQGYKILEKVSSIRDNKHIREEFSENGILNLYKGKDIVLTVDMNKWLQSRVEELQLDTLEEFIVGGAEILKPELMVYQDPEFMLIFDYLTVNASDWTVKNMGVGLFLSKKEYTPVLKR